VRIHDSLPQWVRVDLGRQPSPSEAIIDSESVKSAAMVSQAVDLIKINHRRKTVLAVDTFGLVLRVLVTAANVGERRGQTSAQTGQTDGFISVPFAYDMGRCRF